MPPSVAPTTSARQARRRARRGLRITIVLPPPADRPTGGYKVQYDNASYLASTGNRVTIVHEFLRLHSRARTLAVNARYVLAATVRHPCVIGWYTFPPGVRVLFVPKLHPYVLPPADITILTAWQTSAQIAKRTSWTGPLMQVVYDYEFWLTATPGIQRQIEAAFLRPDVFHVASSTVVSDMLNSIGVSPRALVVPGIDTDSFRQTVDPAQRAAVIGFPLRPEAHKGTEDALEAAAIISRTRPWVRFVGFGDRWTGPLPAAVTSLGYVTERELVDFYNSLSVFVLPSRYEGWGLPAAEAMACGAAVVCADNGGSRDFAIDGETALIVPPHQPQALADAICRLLDDDNLRKRLADAGKARAQVMSLKASASMLRQAIDQAMEL